MPSQTVQAGDKRYCWTCWRNRKAKVKARKDGFGRPMGECQQCVNERGRQALAVMPSLEPTE